jgi:hypothetical protein
MTREEELILHWIEKICLKCEEFGIKYGILAPDAITAGWFSNYKELLSEYPGLMRGSIYIEGFHVGPENSPWDKTYGGGLFWGKKRRIYWKIRFSDLLDPGFHESFNYEFEFRRLNRLFGVE